jgi:hypothetical protein
MANFYVNLKPNFEEIRRTSPEYGKSRNVKLIISQFCCYQFLNVQHVLSADYTTNTKKTNFGSS